MDHVMKIEVQETRHAFRINGVTLAKRHLEKTMGKETREFDKMLAKFLVIVPFLHEAFECPETASESIKYMSTKASGIYNAIGLDEDSSGPFMLVCLQLAGDMPTANNLRKMGPQVARTFGARSEDVSFHKGERDNVIPFACPQNATLH